MKPLLIFYGYEELHNASAQIARTFWEHVPSEDYSPTIICAARNSSFSSKLPLIEIKDNAFVCLIFRVLKKLGLRDLSMIPDVQYYSWNRRACKKAIELLKRERFDYIHTISTPQSTHLLGLRLKNYSGLPLIVQCNDPWHDTSGRKYRYSICANKNLSFEKKVADGADIIIHSNHVIEDIWAERYGDKVAKKIHVVPFSFNIFNLPLIDDRAVPNEKLIISHIGNIYSTRSSMTIFKGIEKFLEEYPKCSDKFIIQFIGEVHQNEKDYVKQHKLDYCVEFLGSIAPEKLSTFYQCSDIFLIIDVVIKRNPNYPSKLMMYYYYQKPILGLTTPGSNLEKELLDSGHSVCYYEDVLAVRDFLYKAITDYNSLMGFNKNEWKKHTIQNVKRIYGEIVNELLSR